MKNKIYACYCCNIHRDALATPNTAQCNDCLRLGRTEPCYHQVVSDENLMGRLKQERQDLLQSWPHLNRYPYTGTKIRFGSTGVIDATTDKRTLTMSQSQGWTGQHIGNF
jgi:hypothetical protein